MRGRWRSSRMYIYGWQANPHPLSPHKHHAVNSTCLPVAGLHLSHGRPAIPAIPPRLPTIVQLSSYII